MFFHDSACFSPSGPASQNPTLAKFMGNVQRHKALALQASFCHMCKVPVHNDRKCKEASCENRFGLLMSEAADAIPSKHCKISDRRPQLNGPSVLSTALSECCTRHSVAHPPNSHHSIALVGASCCYYFSCCCFCLPLDLAPRLITQQPSGPHGTNSACLPAHFRLLHPAAFFSRSSRSNEVLMEDWEKPNTCSFMTQRAVPHQALRPRIQLWQDSWATYNDTRL